jgi:acyl-CoA dehydrogenase
LRDAYIETEAANLMRFKACELFDAGEPCGAEANMAKYLAAKASWEAANGACRRTAALALPAEYDVERKFRETRLYQVAPVSTNLILLVHRPSTCWVCRARSERGRAGIKP